MAGKPRPATNATSAEATSPNEAKRWGSFKEYYEQKERVCVGAEIDASTGRAPDALPPSRYAPRPRKLSQRVSPRLPPSPAQLVLPSAHSTFHKCRAGRRATTGSPRMCLRHSIVSLDRLVSKCRFEPPGLEHWPMPLQSLSFAGDAG